MPLSPTAPTIPIPVSPRSSTSSTACRRWTAFAKDEYSLYAKVGNNASQAEGTQFARLVMSHVDCDTIPFFWQYASRFTIFDNIFATEDTPSSPNAIAMIAGQSGETQWVSPALPSTHRRLHRADQRHDQRQRPTRHRHDAGRAGRQRSAALLGLRIRYDREQPRAHRTEGKLGADEHRFEPDLRHRSAHSGGQQRDVDDGAGQEPVARSAGHPAGHPLYPKPQRHAGRLALVSERL